jgi:hypothetical protein
VNSSGTKLSIYDLMVAATWSEQFDLNQHVESIAESLKSKSFHNIGRDTILKCLSAVNCSGIKQTQIIDLRKIDAQPMQDLVLRVREGLKKAVDLLSTEFGIYNWEFLPYEALLIITCRLCCEGLLDTHERMVRFRQWFWRAAFNERYRVGGENFVSKDIGLVSDFVSGTNKMAADEFGGDATQQRLIKAQFRSNNSTSRAFILALAAKRPCSLITGSAIDVAVALSQYNKKEFHHIYPSAYLKKANASGQHNGLANICMLPAAENNKISDSDPHTYILECAAGLGGNSDQVFESNFLPSPKVFPYATASFEEFTTARATIVALFLHRLFAGEKP